MWAISFVICYCRFTKFCIPPIYFSKTWTPLSTYVLYLLYWCRLVQHVQGEMFRPRPYHIYCTEKVFQWSTSNQQDTKNLVWNVIESGIFYTRPNKRDKNQWIDCRQSQARKYSWLVKYLSIWVGWWQFAWSKWFWPTLEL